MSFQQDFMQEIADTVFGKTPKEEKKPEKRCFLRRFDTENKFKKNTEIAELIKQDMSGGYCVQTMARTLRSTIQALLQKHEAEIKSAGINPESWIHRERGEKGAWEEVYDWLWNHQYLCWLKANSWQFLQDKAKTPANWLQFLTQEEMTSLNRGLMMPPPPVSGKPTIPVNRSLWMAIDLELQPEKNYQLLLLNRSQDGESLLCPSSAFAPNALIDKPPILLPQKDSWAGQAEEQTNFKFGNLETEEFLAIVLEKPLDLPWLTPRPEEILPEWTAERIKELFEKLEQQDNWQVFYQSFEVVNVET